MRICTRAFLRGVLVPGADGIEQRFCEIAFHRTPIGGARHPLEASTPGERGKPVQTPYRNLISTLYAQSIMSARDDRIR